MTLSDVYHLGLPMWGNRDWCGSLFRNKTKPAEYLEQYAAVFNSVEGNTTFYGVPGPDTVARWRDATPSHFSFSFKFPRTISHDLKLRDCMRETEAFLNNLSPLGGRLGPFFLQLPPGFSDLAGLARFLEVLPKNYGYAVEARHPHFYDQGAFEHDFEALLVEQNVDRVLFDTHRLHQVPNAAPDIRKSQQKKPKNPVRHSATGPRPFVRFVGNPQIEADQDVIEDWAKRTAQWIAEGRKPRIYIHHAPDDDLAPRLAEEFHNALMRHVAHLTPLPQWPGRTSGEEPVQMELF